MADEHPTPPLSRRDDLASAGLDGMLDGDELAALESDAEALALMAELRGIAEQLRAVPAVDPERFDQMIAVALAAADEAEAEPEPAAAAAVTALAPRRKRPVFMHPAMAAAVVLVLVAVGLSLILGDRSTSDQSADGSAKTSEEMSAGSGGAANQSEAPRDTPATEGIAADSAETGAPEPVVATTAAPGLVDPPFLGDHPDQASLTAVLAGTDLASLVPPPDAAGEASPPSVTQANIDRCDGAIRAIPDLHLGAPLAVATARLATRPVLVFSYPRVSPPTDGEGAHTATSVPTTAPPAGSTATLLVVADVESCNIEFAVRR